MPTKKTQHYREGEHYERSETTRPDGSQRITESKVIDTPLGRAGSNIVSETNIDKDGNSTTRTRR
ncbi:MAG TPA: hypothetical protein VKK31_31305 [Thermoanaerobaculia bacterium]|nr:hypothetical protein [Thermoanaerobaculia bacterium]